MQEQLQMNVFFTFIVSTFHLLFPEHFMER